MISPICYKCSTELNSPGAVLISPPGATEVKSISLVKKYHLCTSCWEGAINTLHPRPNSKNTFTLENFIGNYVKISFIRGEIESTVSGTLRAEGNYFVIRGGKGNASFPKSTPYIFDSKAYKKYITPRFIINI